MEYFPLLPTQQFGASFEETIGCMGEYFLVFSEFFLTLTNNIVHMMALQDMTFSPFTDIKRHSKELMNIPLIKIYRLFPTISFVCPFSKIRIHCQIHVY